MNTTDFVTTTNQALAAVTRAAYTTSSGTGTSLMVLYLGLSMRPNSVYCAFCSSEMFEATPLETGDFHSAVERNNPRVGFTSRFPAPFRAHTGDCFISRVVAPVGTTKNGGLIIGDPAQVVSIPVNPEFGDIDNEYGFEFPGGASVAAEMFARDRGIPWNGRGYSHFQPEFEQAAMTQLFVDSGERVLTQSRPEVVLRDRTFSVPEEVWQTALLN